MTAGPAAPPGAVWVSDWDADHDDRFFTGAEVDLGALNATTMTVSTAGTQHRTGPTLTNIRVTIDGGDGPELTPAQARAMARALMAAADRAEAVDGID